MVFNLHNKPPTTRVQLRPPESGAGNCESTWMAHVGLGLKDCIYKLYRCTVSFTRSFIQFYAGFTS